MNNETNTNVKCWEVIHRHKVVDASPWLELWVESVRLPDGCLVREYYQLEQPDYAVVFALTESSEVISLWRYKHGPRNVNLGLPAGYVMPDESPLEAAQRELLEETGYKADSWRHLGSFTVDGNRGCGKAHMYLAQELHAIAEPAPDDLEEVELEIMGLEELNLHLQSGKVATLGAAAAISLGLNVLT
ncbi:MAG: NUDIX hydrolase [bacterium]